MKLGKVLALVAPISVSRVEMSKNYSLRVLRFLPRNILSWTVGQLMGVRFPSPIDRWTVEKFVKVFNIDVSEAEFPLDHYQSIGDFFVRRLRDGVRPVASTELVSPSDGVVSQAGRIVEGLLVQAKGINYSLAQLVGDPALADCYRDGHFATIYLAPHNYHHVHSPVDGEVLRFSALGGTLWPVNVASVLSIKNLFLLNERVVVPIETAHGTVTVVFVGATNVGSIRLAFSRFRSNRFFAKRKGIQVHALANPYPVHRGSALGTFHFGSTVILLLPPKFPAVSAIKHGPIRMGEALCT